MTSLWILTIVCLRFGSPTVESSAFPYTTAEKCTKVGNEVTPDLKAGCRQYLVNCRKRAVDSGLTMTKE